MAAVLLLMAAQRHAWGDSATWGTNPATMSWNTAQNWSPSSVPNGPLDVASFGGSEVTQLTISTAVEVNSATFNSGAPAFTVGVQGVGVSLFFSGIGIMNGSGLLQSFMADGGQSGIFFQNEANAGTLTFFGGDAPQFFFTESASAGAASFEVSSNGVFQSGLLFFDDSTAADATISASNFAIIGVYDDATAANAKFTVTTGAILFIADRATADHAVATCIGGNGIYGSSIDLQQFASAGEGSFTALGASTSGEAGSDIEISGNATGANGTFVIGGGAAPDLAGARLSFIDTSTAGSATVTVNGGARGGAGGAIVFEGRARGGNASISLLGNGEMDISNHLTPGVTIGSLNGQGVVFLGGRTLTIGSNNQGATFSGTIQDSGGLTKLGTGVLTLSGANIYSGATTVSAGTLLASNRSGSATGSGAVSVGGGTLGGRGTIAGAVSINGGGFLAPAGGTPRQATLTIQSGLSFNSGSTYNCSFKAKRNKTRSDTVVANGVTISGGATLALSGQVQGTLQSGLWFTVISNSAATPISGSFSNLAEGGIVNVSGANLQASYHGGDGNDLTLTVVP